MTARFGTMTAYECPGAARTARGVDDPEEVDVPNGTCSVEGCDKPIRNRTWCSTHYSRWRRHGDPLIRRGVAHHADPRVRFMEQVQVDASGCWLWTGRIDEYGYGKLHIDGRSSAVSAHRVAYEWFVGPIPEGLVIDHVRDNGCRNRNCVNWVAHLEPVTLQENLRRGRRTEPTCRSGHLYDAENTYIQPLTGRRVCKKCRRTWARNRRLRTMGRTEEVAVLKPDTLAAVRLRAVIAKALMESAPEGFSSLPHTVASQVAAVVEALPEWSVA